MLLHWIYFCGKKSQFTKNNIMKTGIIYYISFANNFNLRLNSEQLTLIISSGLNLMQVCCFS